MAESLNTEFDVVAPGISYLGLNNYGKIMVGDKAFEFYNDRDVNDFVQIPWDEIEYIVADVVLGGRWIPRFAIETKSAGVYRFSASRRTKEVLRACRKHFPEDRMRKAKGAIQVMSDNIKSIFNKRKG